MTLKIHANNEVIYIVTRADIKMDEILEQINEGNSILIETIYNSTYIINCMNINAIEILSNNIPPYSD